MVLYVLFLYDNKMKCIHEPSAAVALDVLAVFYKRIVKKPSMCGCMYRNHNH